jgi:hypothetical protein
MLRTSAAVALMAFAAAPAVWGQAVVSAQSGMIHHFEGKVLLEGERVAPEFGEFPMVADGQTLATENGRVEVLLAPGVFLRLDRGTSFRMISNKLSDTQLEILSGVALVEVTALEKENRLAVLMGDAWAVIGKKGLYEFNADAGRLRVYDGKARVTRGDESAELKKGREVVLAPAAALAAAKFDRDIRKEDQLYAWSSNRAAVLAMANVSLARSALTSGSRTAADMWVWYPAYGVFGYLPRSGYYTSPFGWIIYSPSSYRWYLESRNWNYGGGRSAGWGGLGSGARGAAGGGGGGVYRSSGPSGGAPMSGAGAGRSRGR